LKNDFSITRMITIMTKKIKLETETKTNYDFQNVQIEICNTTLTSIQKRLETMHKKLWSIELKFKDFNDKQLYRIRYKNKK